MGKDQATGRPIIDARKLEIMLNMEKDKFYLATGYKAEQIAAYLKKIQEESRPSAEERLAMFQRIS